MDLGVVIPLSLRIFGLECYSIKVVSQAVSLVIVRKGQQHLL